MKRLFFLFINLCLCTIVFAQLVSYEQPYSLRKDFASLCFTNNPVDKKILPKLDLKVLEEEDKIEEKENGTYRFAILQDVDFSLKNSGTWTILPNGDKIWHLSIQCPNAKSIYLVFNRFWIPEGGKFFIYSPDLKQSLGAYTSKNCKKAKEEVFEYATGLIQGEEIFLEYYQPKEISIDADISLNKVANGYRETSVFFAGYGDANSSQVDINCSEGTNWQNEKRAVCFILHDGYVATGALVNNSSYDYQPLVLTADHNLNGADAINSPYLNDWLFYWKYENVECGNSTLVSGYNTFTVGATIIANNSDSDFALLSLTEDPRDLSNFEPYYLGWDSSGNAGAGGVCIHHPVGDSKKIATYTMTPLSVSSIGIPYLGNQFYWKVNFISTNNGYGFPEGGSSGAPLIANSSHKVLGQLKSGGSSSNSDFYYGKFNISWSGNGSSNPKRRLRDWLDPLNVGLQSLDGYDSSSSNPTFSIIGESYFNIGNSYNINNIPNGFSVVWSVNNSAFTLYESGSSCNISYVGSLKYEEAILTATISISGNYIKTIHKSIIHIGDIEGPTVICDNEAFVLDIPACYTITWSINNNSFSLSPSGNQCCIFNSGTTPTSTIAGTLNANISINGELVGIRTKKLYILGSSYNVEGIQEQYISNLGNYPEQSFNIISSAQTEINGGCTVSLSSEHFLEKEISFVGNYQPLNIVHNSNLVSFTTQAQNDDYTLMIKAQSDKGCSDFNLNFLITPIPYLNDPELIVSLYGSGNSLLSVHLMTADGEEISPELIQEPTWTMSIRSLQTGLTMTTQQIQGSTTSVYVGNYATGIYVVTASISLNGELKRYSSRFVKQ